MNPSKDRMPLLKALLSGGNDDQDSVVPPVTDSLQQSLYAPTGFNSDSAGSASSQDPPQPIDPRQISVLLTDFSQFLPQYGGNAVSALHSPASTSTSDGSAMDFDGLLTPTTFDNHHSMQDALPPTTSVPDFVSQIQGPQYLVNSGHQNLMNSYQNNHKDDWKQNSAPQNALSVDVPPFAAQFPGTQNVLSSPPITHAAAVDFNAILSGILGPLTQKTLDHVNHPSHKGNAVEALGYCLNSQITGDAQTSQNEQCSSNSPASNLLFNHAFFQTLMANAAFNAAQQNSHELPSHHQSTAIPNSKLKRSAPSPLFQSSSAWNTSTPKTVAIGSPPIPPFAKKSRRNIHPIALTLDQTVASSFGTKSRFSRKSIDISQQFLAQKPSGKINMNDIVSYIYSQKQDEGASYQLNSAPEQDEEEMEDEGAGRLPITGRLKGVEKWTKETSEGYEKRVSQYIGRRTPLTHKIKKLVPRVLTADEKAEKRAEAEEYVRNCPLYKDPLQSVRSSLFDVTKPDFPQKVRQTVGRFVLFKAYHAANFCSDPNEKWNELKEENGEEYWRWTKKSLDLRDEHLRQCELGFITFRKCAPKSGKEKTGNSGNKDRMEDHVVDQGSVGDEESDSETIDVVG